MAPKTIDQRKLELEVRRIEIDAELRRAELEEKRAQREADYNLKLKELEVSAGKGLRFSSGQATVLAGALSLLSGVVGGVFQAWVTHDTESGKNNALIAVERTKVDGNIAIDRQKFETSLIFQAINTPDRDTQVKNLQFFAKFGFIHDPDKKIQSATVEDLPSPTIDPLSGMSARPNNDYTGLSPKLIEFIRSVGEIPDGPALRRIVDQISSLVHVPLNENQVIALTSFVYNVGSVAFRSSVLEALNRSDFDGATNAMLRWNKVAGREFEGLTRRRQAEVALFKTPPNAAPERSP